MSLTPERLAEIREQHIPGYDSRCDNTKCLTCRAHWPCDTYELRVEVERLQVTPGDAVLAILMRLGEALADAQDRIDALETKARLADEHAESLRKLQPWGPNHIVPMSQQEADWLRRYDDATKERT